MIDIGKILKRSWHILWNYRVLWIFGFLLVITAGGNGAANSIRYQFSSNRGNNGSNGTNPNFQPGPFLHELTDWFNQNITPLFEHPNQHVTTFIWIGAAFLLFILVVGVIAAITRYVSETAVIRMVDEYEQIGTKVGFKQGWKMGWNRRAFRMWVIDLVIILPFILFIALLVCLGLLFFFSVINGNAALAISGTIAAIGCAFLFIFAFVILMVFLRLLRQFFVRAAALEGAGIGESFRRGWNLFKNNWKSAVLMWLVMLGIGFGFGIVGMILFFLLIPAYLILILPAAIVAAIPAAIALGITSIFASGPMAWIVAILVAVTFFLLITLAPLTLVSGWYQIYISSVWTLTYREIKALEVVKPAEIPAKTA
ncbi:MAG: hypothetical protein NTV38_02070 [Chloroflexi bacterium]|nr:hypothetical protein [Chloroflexota bacterium]